MKENLFQPDCIRTFTGKYVNVFSPTPDMICIEDIAHSLAQQPRFGGHLPKFYSVAQHSIHVAELVGDPKLKLAALLHDASEAYMLDIPSPIKNRLINYKAFEYELMEIIAEKFGFDWPLAKEIKEADELMLKSEWETLMLEGKEGYHTYGDIDITPFNVNAKPMFLSMYAIFKNR